jgi:hypothetical protein
MSVEQDQAREITAIFLWSELDVAGTFVSVAESAVDGETVLRNVTNAWMALRAAQGYAEQLDLDAHERAGFRQTHRDLCRRLAELQMRPEPAPGKSTEKIGGRGEVANAALSVD